MVHIGLRSGKAKVSKGSMVVSVGTRKTNNYVLEGEVDESCVSIVDENALSNAMKWHIRLGHTVNKDW